jgi:hypothetical protein
MLVPPIATGLRVGDQILFCGTADARSGLNISVNNSKALTYIVDGIEVPDSLVWRWVKGFLARK